MPITRTDRNQTFRDGQLVAEEIVVVDVTADVVTLDIHTRARQAILDNKAFLAVASPTNAQTLAQVRRLTRQTNAIIRLLIGSDLLVENTDT